ncbi:MAG: HAMP domain-containing sensor histidine kinase [Umezawaea sp.]
MRVEAATASVVFGVLLWEGDRLDGLWPDLPAGDVFAILTLIAAVVAAAGAIVARLSPPTADASNRRLAGPLAFYGVVMIPASVLHMPAEVEPGIAVGFFVASTLFLALMVRALRPTAAPGIWWPKVVVLAVLVTVGAGVMGQTTAVTRDPAGPTLATTVVVLGWCLTSVIFVVIGGLRHHRVTWRIGFGLAMVAIAHLDEIAIRPELTRPDLDFAALRLLGLLVVLVALARPAIKCMRVEREQLAKAESTARELAADVEERDHEIRNLVSGLSGVTHLMTVGGSEFGSRAWTTLGAAVQQEVDRLSHLLGHTASENGDAVLDPLLARLATLRRARGAHVELQLQPGLRTTMPAPELAQVITNLLANCERHAPGAPVWIRAFTRDSTVRIEVADDGPGLTAEQVRRVLSEGEHDPSAGGSGVGLRVCARLLHAYGGALRIRPRGDGAAGCTVIVQVPAVVSGGERVTKAM